MKLSFFIGLCFLSGSLLANDNRCIERLDSMVGNAATLVETSPSDGSPLEIRLTNFNSETGRIEAFGTKAGETFSMVTGSFNIKNCEITSRGVRFKLQSGLRGVTIQENGTEFRASTLGWSGNFILQ